MQRLRMKDADKMENSNKAFGGLPERQMHIDVRPPFRGAFREDLMWALQYTDDRLDELDVLFSSGQLVRPQGGAHNSQRDQITANEERELKAMRPKIAFELARSLPSKDDAKRQAKLDALTEQRSDSSLYQISLFENQNEFHEAYIRRLLMPQIRIDVRKEFFREGT